MWWIGFLVATIGWGGIWIVTGVGLFSWKGLWLVIWGVVVMIGAQIMTKAEAAA